MWPLLLGVTLLALSAYFTAYLVEFNTSSFQEVSFAKIISIAVFFIGLIMLFVSIGWWCMAGIPGYWILLVISRIHWHNRLGKHNNTYIDP